MLKSESIADNLPPLPGQPDGVPWPTSSWPKADPKPRDAARFERLADEIFDLEGGKRGVTYALLAVKGGELVYERYDHGASAFYLQYSWSMAKSVVQALVGILVRQGKLDIYARANVPEWQRDARREITLDQLLRMSSGLQFNEDYVDGEISRCHSHASVRRAA
ncbi:MAG: serine hydrolase [Gammaproteobacteria bacterium]|nr:serine hydrolase [Gammaproteobacteria bacterium]